MGQITSPRRGRLGLTSAGQNLFRPRAVELKKHADALRAYAQTCDDALNVLLGAGDQMGAQLNEIHRLGCANPSHSQLFSLGQRAITTVLMRSPWSRAFSPITPAEKTRFVDFVGAWERMLRERNCSPAGRRQVNDAERLRHERYLNIELLKDQMKGAITA